MAAPGHDWFLKEWLATLGKKQSDIVNDLGWNKSKISLMVRGKQAYTREEVNELAAYLHLFPHELLMHPDDAMALRRMRLLAEQFIAIPHGGATSDETAQSNDPLKKVS